MPGFEDQKRWNVAAIAVYVQTIDGILTVTTKLNVLVSPIIGSIDGFSRKILWLEIVNFNNDPFVTASAYLNFISKLKLYHGESELNVVLKIVL